MNTPESLQPLAHALLALTPPPQHPALRQLVETLRTHYTGCVKSILFYGSCLRGGDPYDGLVDLYLIVDNYRCANHGWLKALWNRLLPPNVFYTEVPFGEHRVRCKYAILSERDMRAGTSPRWFQSYLWGRFSQPTAIAWSSDSTSQLNIATNLAQAVVTFLQRTLPSLPERGSVPSLWQQGLALSYATELRPESSQRTADLTQANAVYYLRVTELAAPLLAGAFRCEDGGYRTVIPGARRFGNRLGWRLRKVQGKVLSLTRLSKALLTFEGGLDYIAWKLERHSGQRVEVPERVRRYPLLFIWGLMWDLYRRGVFR